MGSPSRSYHTNPMRRGTGAAIHGDGGVQQKLGNSDEDKPEKVYCIFYFKGDRSKVALLQHQAKTSDALDVKDVSLKEEVKSNNWKPEAKKHIAQSDQVIVAVGKDTSDREAVKWEILEALRQGKPIVAVRLNRDTNDPLPDNVKEEDAVVWNLEDIQDEIDKNKRERKRKAARQDGENNERKAS